jgi:hypothetical protein
VHNEMRITVFAGLGNYATQLVKLSSALLNHWAIPIALNILSTPSKLGAREGMMIWVLNIDVAIDAIRNAFCPLTCTVELYDYQGLVRLRVFDHENRIILFLLTLSMRDIVNPSILRSELNQARARVERKGFRLRSWTAPRWETYIRRAYQSA